MRSQLFCLGTSNKHITKPILAPARLIHRLVPLVPMEKKPVDSSVGIILNYEKQTSHEYSSFYKPTTQNKFAFTLSRNALMVTKRGRNMPALVITNSYKKARSKYKHVMRILRSFSHLCKTSSLLHQVETR